MPDPDLKSLVKGVADSDPMMRIGTGMAKLNDLGRDVVKKVTTTAKPYVDRAKSAYRSVTGSR